MMDAVTAANLNVEKCHECHLVYDEHKSYSEVSFHRTLWFPMVLAGLMKYVD